MAIDSIDLSKARELLRLLTAYHDAALVVLGPSGEAVSTAARLEKLLKTLRHGWA